MIEVLIFLVGFTIGAVVIFQILKKERKKLLTEASLWKLVALKTQDFAYKQVVEDFKKASEL